MKALVAAVVRPVGVIEMKVIRIMEALRMTSSHRAEGRLRLTNLSLRVIIFA